MNRFKHIITGHEVQLEEVYTSQVDGEEKCAYKKMTPVFLIGQNGARDMNNPLYDFVKPSRVFNQFYKPIKNK